MCTIHLDHEIKPYHSTGRSGIRTTAQIVSGGHYQRFQLFRITLTCVHATLIFLHITHGFHLIETAPCRTHFRWFPRKKTPQKGRYIASIWSDYRLEFFFCVRPYPFSRFQALENAWLSCVDGRCRFLPCFAMPRKDGRLRHSRLNGPQPVSEAGSCKNRGELVVCRTDVEDGAQVYGMVELDASITHLVTGISVATT